MNDEDRRQDRLTLEMLSAIDAAPEVSQRRLANQMGIALGLANSYIKRCVRMGFIKINEAPANRYIYYLTPKGFREKTRLTAQFLSSSLDFYRKAAESCEQVYHRCEHDGVSKVVLCGNSELAEIAFLKSVDARVEVLGLYDEKRQKTSFFSLQIWQRLENLPDVAKVVTCVDGADRMIESLHRRNGDRKIYVPDLLGLEDRG